jgi:hypothetical protein
MEEKMVCCKHEDNNKNNDSHCNKIENVNEDQCNKRNKHKHMLIMLHCCLIPLIVLLIVRFLFPSEKVNGLWSIFLVLLCPLMHIVMMAGIFFKKN